MSQYRISSVDLNGHINKRLRKNEYYNIEKG